MLASQCVAEGNRPRDGTVPFEREEVLTGAGDEAAVVHDERCREGTGSPRWRMSCKGNPYVSVRRHRGYHAVSPCQESLVGTGTQKH
nr:unnamed protein product [Digitaria exilis]